MGASVTKMMATLELVQQAQEELRKGGMAHPSADAILAHIKVGSKNTVLNHMRTLAENAARSAPDGEVPIEMLRTTAERMARQLWQSAAEMAAAAHGSKLEAMLSSQGARYEDLQKAATVESELRAELVSARARIAELEQQLAERDDTGDRLAAIVEMLRAKGGPAHPPIVQLLRFLDAAKPRSREDLFDLMVEAGHSRKQASTALSEARKRGYADEAEEGVRIAAAGTDRLQNGRRRA